MPEVVVVAIVGSLRALATGLGVVPVVLLGARAERLRPFLWGVTIGVMTIAALAGSFGLPSTWVDQGWL